ncbi:putative drought induced 19 type, zinc-binding protein [Helianthus anomalus]
MDSDFWTARLAAAKRQFTMQHHHHQTSHLGSRFDDLGYRFNVEDVEVEEEIRPDFPCPYCYEDFDIGSLCSHLEDEHSCESKAAGDDWGKVLLFVVSVFCNLVGCRRYNLLC